MQRLTQASMRLLVLGVVMTGGWPADDGRQAYSLRRIAFDEAAGGDATLAPDGRRFVTTSRRSGDWELWIFEIDTRRWTRVTHTPGEDFEAKWSPEGHRLVFTSGRDGQKDIWSVDLRTGQQKRLTTSPDDDEYPAWSPDGRFIIYTGGPWNARDFLLVPADGGPPRKVSRVSGRAGACAFDPGGDTAVCHRYDAGSGDVVRLWLADGEEVPLTGGSGWDYKPTASPDGRLVAFSRSLEGPSHIWLMAAGGGRPWPLTDDRFDDRWPTWSDSSNRVLFHRAVDESQGVQRLDLRQPAAPVTIVPASENPLQASLHPDGGSIAYCADEKGGRRLKIRNLALGAARGIEIGAEACYPRWSPDGQWVAFSIRRGGRWHVAVARPDGSGLRVLTEGRADLRGMDGPLDWSPDGTRLVFHADTEPFEARLYTVVLASGVIDAVTGPGFFDEAPSWSPDGTEILFMSTRGGNWTWTLYRLNLATRTLRPFTVPDWVEKNYPRAAPDGAVAWAAADADGENRLMEQRQGASRTLAGAGAGVRWPAYSRDGRFITYTRVAHRVEFWLAENPAAAPRPTAPGDAAAGRLVPRPQGESPHGFHRR